MTSKVERCSYVTLAYETIKNYIDQEGDDATTQVEEACEAILKNKPKWIHFWCGADVDSEDPGGGNDFSEEQLNLIFGIIATIGAMSCFGSVEM